MKKRIPTFIDGFDNMIEGGLPDDNSLLIQGGPGTLKTTIAYYILDRNSAMLDFSVVYMSFEQERKNFVEHMEHFGIVMKDSNVRLVDLGLIRNRNGKVKKRSW